MFEHLLRLLLRPVALGWNRFFYRIEFEGVERIPDDGPLIFTPNHVAYTDPIWVTIPLKRRVYYMAWDALFRMSPVARFLRFFGAFPVRIEGHDKRAMREALDLLAADRALMIFPEGGRSESGKLIAFKPGAFRLALYTGARIVPVTIDGGYDVWPTGRLLPRLRGRVRIVYHEPIDVERVGDHIETAELRRRSRSLALQARAAVASALESTWVEPDADERDSGPRPVLGRVSEG